MTHRATLFFAAIVIAAAPLCLRGEETVKVEVKDLTLAVPKTWNQQKPSNNMRLTQFELPPVEGDKEAAELVVFSFPGGGEVEANIKRWIDQFHPEGRQQKVTQGKSEQGEYYVVEVSGTYNKSVGPPVQGKTEAVPGSRMISIIVITAQKNVYFLKLTGFDKTVQAASAPFRASFGGNAEKEQPYSK